MTASNPAPADLLMPRMRPPQGGALTLSVLDGVHRGVETPIMAENCTIGSASHCDVVLADDRIAPDHLRLRFYGRQVAVDAIGGDVGIEGRAPVPQGHGARVALPVTLTLGDVRLQVRRPALPAGMAPRWLPLFGLGLAGLIAAILFATQSNGFGTIGAVDRPATPTPQIAATTTAQTDVAQTLRQHLTQAGVQGLDVTQDGRRVLVSGALPAAGMQAWQDAQQWFDGTYGGRYVLTSRVTAAPAGGAPDFSFQAVWFGANPYVIDARGDRRYPGAALKDGWMLKSIDPGRITVTRNGTDFQLTL